MKEARDVAHSMHHGHGAMRRLEALKKEIDASEVFGNPRSIRPRVNRQKDQRFSGLVACCDRCRAFLFYDWRDEHFPNHSQIDSQEEEAIQPQPYLTI